MRAYSPNVSQTGSVRLRALPLLMAVLLVALQATMPLAHAVSHLVTASSAWAHAHAAQGAAAASHLTASVADERACPLCAVDHDPALPGRARATVCLSSCPADTTVLLARVRSTAPLDVFCRPPPTA